MSANLHPATTERNFGLLVAILAAAAALYSWWHGHGTIARPALLLTGLLLVTALAAPARLRGLCRAWLKFGELLHRMVSPVALGAIYFLVLTPVAVVRRLVGLDALHRRFEPGRPSYWVERTGADPAPESFRDPF